jgi:hypothetical protein
LGESGSILDLGSIMPVGFAVSASERNLFVIDQIGGSIHRVAFPNSSSPPSLLGRHVHDTPFLLRISQDERTLVSAGVHDLYAWDLNRWRVRWSRWNADASAAVIPPDRHTLLCCTSEYRQPQLEEIDLDIGRTLQVVVRNIACLRQMVVSPCGRF